MLTNLFNFILTCVLSATVVYVLLHTFGVMKIGAVSGFTIIIVLALIVGYIAGYKDGVERGR